MLNARRPHLGGAIPLTLTLGTALLLVGCTPAVEAEQGPIRATATLFENFDGRCGFGLEVHNGGSEPVEFPQEDWASVGGVSLLEWHIPFGSDSAPDGYDITTKLPPTIEGGQSARIAFVTNCDGDPVEISVNPIGLEPVVLTPFG